jgi:hypothetical protein
MTTEIRVIVASREEAYNGNAEFWCGAELMAVTLLREGQLQLRIDSRANGEPWLIGTTSLSLGLAEAARQLAAY